MPDLNSMPLSASRRASTSQTAPDQTSPSLNILPSNQQAVQQASQGILPSPSIPTTSMPPPSASNQDNTGVGSGPGPLRHPQPMTAAQLHTEVEQEQELLVNRLTRDLSMLRAAQNSSVVSNASSTSASTSAEPGAHPSSFTDTHLMSGPGPIPTSRRHHRTSSSTSARSISQMASQGSTPAPIAIPQTHSGNAASILEAARNPRVATSMSRQNSSASHRSRSRGQSPQPYHGLTSSSYGQSHGFPYEQTSTYFPRGHSSNPSVAATPGSELSPGLMPATLRYEETAHYRQELDSAKHENENLKKRVKELEMMLRERREGDASLGRGRSESTSTATSVSVGGAAGVGGGGVGIAGGRQDVRRGVERTMSTVSYTGSVATGVPEDEVKVGESAASSGLRAEGSQVPARSQSHTPSQILSPESK
ncbi:hypothetical protein F5Y15DRAFT_376853 [Xylariaceae sp. FL0016]|nr:hypothetical protein F5Y15DRAFT_376853 [Xylariaceae sp. FL0016]